MTQNQPNKSPTWWHCVFFQLWEAQKIKQVMIKYTALSDVQFGDGGLKSKVYRGSWSHKNVSLSVNLSADQWDNYYFPGHHPPWHRWKGLDAVSDVRICSFWHSFCMFVTWSSVASCRGLLMWNCAGCWSAATKPDTTAGYILAG